MRQKVIIAGAAGRDFHTFNTCYRNRPEIEVVAFTATQIPNIDHRVYPPSLAGPWHTAGIPIEPEENLEALIRDHQVDSVVFAYSDVSYEYVMSLSSRVIAAGADFVLPGSRASMLESKCHVISVCAMRTGSGKSQTTRYVAGVLEANGLKTVVVRHPMPYGDLAAQAVQRFATFADLDRHHTTIEEREEYEPHLDEGRIVYAGVDYEAILRQAEAEADVLLWDGGNNDLPFYRSDLHLVVLDPLRPDDIGRYHPSEANVRMADVFVVNKIDSATPEQIATVERAARLRNSHAPLLRASSPTRIDDPSKVTGRRVLVIEDGPTLTHGGMSYGAGVVAARRAGAAEIVDPRPYAVGSIRETFEKYPSTGPILPAMGYSEHQIEELEATIDAVPADTVVVATPIDLRRVLRMSKPSVRVHYDLELEPDTDLDAYLLRVPAGIHTHS